MLFPLSNTFSPNLQPYLILEPALNEYPQRIFIFDEYPQWILIFDR